MRDNGSVTFPPIIIESDRFWLLIWDCFSVIGGKLFESLDNLSNGGIVNERP